MGKPKNTAGDMNGSGYEWEYAKKVDNRSLGQKISNFLYDPSTGVILGRTPKSWGGILLFYVVFYTILGLFFSVCMKLLMMSIEEDIPKFTLTDSLIGTTPGLGFRPMANDTEAASLIYYNNETKQTWIDTMKKFREQHYKYEDKKIVKCDYGQTHHLADDQSCNVDWEKFGDCSASKNFGYDSNNSTCVFVKLNKIFNWEPDYYKDNDFLDAPDITEATREEIRSYRNQHPKHVWLTCNGQSAHDKDNCGEIRYHPLPGFPHYYYPYKNAKNYMSPLVAVQFVGLKRGVMINIECKAWAKNIVHQSSSQLREGGVHFELMIEDDKKTNDVLKP